MTNRPSHQESMHHMSESMPDSGVEVFRSAYRRFRTILLLLTLLAAILAVHLVLRLNAGIHSNYDISAVGLLTAAMLVLGMGVVRCLGALSAEAVRRFERMAFYDHLTGVHNYRWVLDRLEEEVARANRQGRPLALIYLDVDALKQVNDRLGHAAGNQVLTELGAILNASLRQCDSVGRIGGDEFLVVMPDTSGGDALFIAERVLDEIRNLSLPETTGPATGNLSVSAGIAEWSADKQDVDGLLRAADEAMYRAKRRGGNRVHMSPPTQPAPLQRTLVP